MDGKIRLNFRLSPTSNEYIAEAAEKEHCSKTEIVERIIREHMEIENTSTTKDEIANLFLEKYKAEYKDFNTRMRLATNYNEQNIQVVIELLNSIMYSLNLDNVFLTDIETHPAIEEAKSLVKNRISNFKQVNDNKNKGKS